MLATFTDGFPDSSDLFHREKVYNPYYTPSQSVAGSPTLTNAHRGVPIYVQPLSSSSSVAMYKMCFAFVWAPCTQSGGQVLFTTFLSNRTWTGSREQNWHPTCLIFFFSYQQVICLVKSCVPSQELRLSSICQGLNGQGQLSSIKMVCVCAIADHRHQYKLTGVTRYICVSSPVRCMSLSPHMTYGVTHVTMISHLSDNQWLRSCCIAVTVTLCTLYIYAPCIMCLI